MKKDTMFGTILSAAIVMASGMALAQGTTGTPGATPGTSGSGAGDMTNQPSQAAPATPGSGSGMGTQQGADTMGGQQGAQSGTGTMGAQPGTGTTGAATPDMSSQAAMSPPEDVVGKSIVNAEGDEIGEISAIDGNQVIVEVGGFLGLGARDVAVDWSRIQATGAGDQMELTTSLTKEELEAMPEYQQ